MKTSSKRQVKLQIYLFGSPEIWQGGALVHRLSAKSQAILYFLAATQQAQRRSTLATLLWGDLSEARARANLRKELQSLRNQVGEHLRIDRDVVSLIGTNSWVDVQEFMAVAREDSAASDLVVLQRAIDLLRGDFLNGFQVRNAIDFEEWMAAEQAKLREIAARSLDRLATLYIERNEPKLAINIVRRIIDLEPWREEAHRRLIELLADDGDISAALAHYAICRDMLREELDVEPSPETERLRLSLQDGTFRQGGGPETTTRDAPGETRIGSHTQAVTRIEYPLSGREAEWETLSSLWNAVQTPHFVCIGGESGIGKTRLAEELLVQVEQAGRFSARTRCYALERQMVYGPVVDWLRTPALKSNLARLEPIWLTEISRLLPEIAHEYPDLPSPQPLTESRQQKRFFDALVHAFTVSQSALLLVLDDLQWCDGETLAWIQYLVESTGIPLLVVGTVRTDEIEDMHSLQQVQQQLAHQGKLTEISLKPLRKEAVATLARNVAERSQLNDVSATLFEDTAGNPLFVIESVRAKQSRSTKTISTITHNSNDILSRGQVSLPPRMFGVIRSRLVQLSSQAQIIAQFAATIGRQFDVALLAEATQFDEEAIFHRLDELWQRRLVRHVDAIRFDFSHDRIRDVAYAEISPVKRPLFHRKIAVALETLYLDGPEPYYGELAAHYEFAGQYEKAILYCQKSAHTAAEIFAHQKTLSSYQEALRLLRSLPVNRKRKRLEIDLLDAIGQAHQDIHGFGHLSSGEAWLEAYNEALTSGSVKQKNNAASRLSSYNRYRSNWKDSKSFAVQALDWAMEADETRLVAKAAFDLAVTDTHLGNFTQSLPRFAEVDSFLPSVDDDPPKGLVGKAIKHGHTMWFLGYPDQAKRLGFRALKQSRKSWRDLPMVLNLVSMTIVYLRDLSTLAVLNPEQIEVSERQNSPFFLRCANMYRGWLMAQEGKADEGAEIIRVNSDLHRQSGNLIFDVFYRSLLAESYLQIPDPELVVQQTFNAG